MLVYIFVMQLDNVLVTGFFKLLSWQRSRVKQGLEPLQPSRPSWWDTNRCCAYGKLWMFLFSLSTFWFDAWDGVKQIFFFHRHRAVTWLCSQGLTRQRPCPAVTSGQPQGLGRAGEGRAHLQWHWCPFCPYGMKQQQPGTEWPSWYFLSCQHQIHLWGERK